MCNNYILEKIIITYLLTVNVEQFADLFEELQSSTIAKLPCINIKHLVNIDFIIVHGRHKVSTCNTIPKPGIDM